MNAFRNFWIKSSLQIFAEILLNYTGLDTLATCSEFLFTHPSLSTYTGDRISSVERVTESRWFSSFAF
jgi:hypothetical protein